MAASGRCWPTAASFACEESHPTLTCSGREETLGERLGVAQGCNCRSILDAIAMLIEALQAILHGRWGVVQPCKCRKILDAIASLIEAERSDLAMVLIEGEMNSQK